MQLTDTPAAQPHRAARAPPPMPNSRRPSQQRSRHQRYYLRCGHSGAEPGVYTGSADSGVMWHTGQKHGGHPLLQSVAQLRQLDRAACEICGTIRSRRRNRCNQCRADTRTRDVLVGDMFPDRRQLGHQDVAASQPNPHQPSATSQPIAAGDG